MSMRILLAAYGSRGDVQPLVALGKGLQAAGYTVIVAAGRNFGDWITHNGLSFEPFTEDIEAAMNTDVGKEWLSNSSGNPMQELANMRKMVQASAPHIVPDLLRMADCADVFISGMLTLAPFDAIAQATGKRHLVGWLSPVVPTRSGSAGMQAPLPRANSLVNYGFGYVVESMLWSIFGDVTNQLRAALKLPPAGRSDYLRAMNQTPSIAGFSPRVVPPPPDWGAQHRVTGYWTLPAPDYTPPADLAAFLAAGEAPVYIGFGSMTSTDPAGTMRIMIDALTQAGRRGILHSGWAGLKARDLPETIHVVDHVPHEWLLPRMAAVVHHGGAGTTGAALQAGVPSLVVAHMGDQPYWGRRVYELGVGAPFIRRVDLTADRLAAALRAMTTDTAMQARAAELGAALRREDGVSAAVRAVGEIVG
ncbi:MAG: glycosyltransferase [Chloroflexota bacterium]|nr:glycosyltransferase [Chloroflexota bacterium]